jgi:hypothetical protein
LSASTDRLSEVVPTACLPMAFASPAAPRLAACGAHLCHRQSSWCRCWAPSLCPKPTSRKPM